MNRDEARLSGEVTGLERVRVVLVHTTHPGNIGAAARAMKTMGLSRLYLVSPRHFPAEIATARASGADDILSGAVVVPALQDALHGVACAAALTARRRELAVPPVEVREAARRLVAEAGQGADVALVFGTEHSGLSNEDVRLCSLPVTIPANPAYSSLNLGAAVQVLCYELRLAMLDAASRPAGDGEQAVAATFDEIEGFHSHLERAMRASGFFDPTNPKRLLPRLRRLFGRIRLERDEVNILRGIIAAFERQAAGAVQGATRSKECSSD